MSQTSVEKAIQASQYDFAHVVWPRLGPLLGGGNLIPVESVTDSMFAQLLDRYGMTDTWQVVHPSATQPPKLRALATRIQWGDKCWGSWTVRYRLRSGGFTEYHKLTMADECHHPQWIIQAYLSERGGSLLGAAAIRSSDLTFMLLDGLHGPPKSYAGNKFVPVWWEEARMAGYPVVRLDGKAGA